MKKNKITPVLCWSVNLFCFLLICTNVVFADYIEGTDTTNGLDSAFKVGYGLDSAFMVYDGYIHGQNLANYYFGPCLSSGYFNYSFDEIKIAPDKILESHVPQPRASFYYYCFVVCNQKDSTYSKVQFIRQLGDTRFIFRYGTTTIPKSRLLVKENYDKSIKYNVNDFHNSAGEYPTPGAGDTLTWDPPLPNNNHLLGYILFTSKSNQKIDTTVAINPAQWDSIAYYTATKVFCPQFPLHKYFNMVTQYSEGKSDFLKGWSASDYCLVNAQRKALEPGYRQEKMEIKKQGCGLLIYRPRTTDNSVFGTLSIYTMKGSRIARLVNNANPIFWNAAGAGIPSGMYICKFESPQGRSLTQRINYQALK